MTKPKWENGKDGDFTHVPSASSVHGSPPFLATGGDSTGPEQALLLYQARGEEEDIDYGVSATSVVYVCQLVISKTVLLATPTG